MPALTASSDCVYLQSSPDHPSLHSFPTRRSSDLVRDGERIAAPRPLPDHQRDELVVAERRGPMTAQFLARPIVGRQVLHLDRKSTRLNSSHRCISYAVFCLKKKNILMTVT